MKGPAGVMLQNYPSAILSMTAVLRIWRSYSIRPSSVNYLAFPLYCQLLVSDRLATVAWGKIWHRFGLYFGNWVCGLLLLCLLKKTVKRLKTRVKCIKCVWNGRLLKIRRISLITKEIRVS